MKAALFLAILPLLILTSCSQEPVQIAQPSDYNQYLVKIETPATHSLEADIAFWQDRLARDQSDENPQVKLAQLFSARFKQSGQVADMHTSDSLYHLVLDRQAEPSASLYQALAQNAITQHQFQKARQYAERALERGDRKAATTLVMVDVALELGNDYEAGRLLNSFSNQSSFAHLVRQSKLSDHQGDLETAIVLMEQAFERIKGNEDLFCWSLSNLGDMYGHAGRVEDAYAAYLDVLAKDPAYDYALKGIAWIALSHDQNLDEAKRIISALQSRKPSPEWDLLQAEIAELEGDYQAKLTHLDQFVKAVNTPGYKTMYHKYLLEIYAEEWGLIDESLSIAEEEIASRPTPQSYDLMAWSLLHSGQAEKALEITKDFVQDRTSEPDALYHTGMIYLANRQMNEAKDFLIQALESRFELGPTRTANIQKTLDQI